MSGTKHARKPRAQRSELDRRCARCHHAGRYHRIAADADYYGYAGCVFNDCCAIHLCACGCGGKTVIPFSMWEYKNDRGLVTFSPSISNAQFCPNKAHYFIERNAVRWA